MGNKEGAGGGGTKAPYESNTESRLACYYANVQSISNKWTEIKNEIDNNNFKIIGFTETWCKEETNEELDIKNFQMFRSDRTGARRGGVLLYLNDSLGAAR